MRIQKIILSSIFITLFLFIFTQSASAATCGRVDSNGDYWYQCNNNQITKIAVTFFNDRISNFATTTTTVSWNFYDGLTHATTSYSNLLPPYNFGGTYTNEILTVINPLTSTYSCPTGYTAYQFIAYGRRNDYNNYYCLANQNIPSLVNFGGMYATDNRDSSVISNNPITGNATCPSGYISQAFGRSENNYETGYYCYATSSSVVPVSKFGGLYIPTCVNEDFKNIVTNNYSCPYNFSDAEVFKTSCNGVHLCYQRCDSVQDVNLTISSNTQNYDLFTAAGSPTCPVNVNLTINSGVTVSSATTSKAAIYGSQNLPTGSAVKIINNGTIHGKGGKGGDGQYPIAWYQAGAASPILNSMIEGEPGKSGSDAISIIADTKIFNSAGKILSGGGGGGGGKVIVGSYCSGSAGGNGGSGGAGGGAGGIWNRPYNFVGMNGNNGTSGTGGTGGAGTLTMCMSGWGMGSYGGKGGNYGENGQNGGGYSTFYYDGTTVQHGSFYPCDFGFNSSSCNAGGSAGKSINNVDNFSLCVNGKTPETVKGDILGTYDTNCNVCGTIQTKNLTISSNTQNYDLFTAAGSPTCPVNVNLTINSGIVVSSATTSKAAIYGSSNLPTGSTVNIINNGTIHGKGGKGGPISTTNVKGYDGSNAIGLIASTTVNNFGYIFGGGGGGGAGSNANTGGGGAGGGENGINNAAHSGYMTPSTSGTSGFLGKRGLGSYVVYSAWYDLDGYGGNGGGYGEKGQVGNEMPVQYLGVDGGYVFSGTNPLGPYYGGEPGKSVTTNNFYLCLHGNTPDRVKGTILGTRDTSCDSAPLPTKPVKPTLEKYPSTVFSFSCGTGINVDWSTSTNATTYKLYRAVTADTISTPDESAYVGPIFSSNNIFTYNDTAFTKDKRNHYVIEACNDTGCTKSDNVYVDILSECDDPNDLSGFVPTSIGALCKATQGTSTKIYLNKQITWEIVPTGVTPRDIEWFSYFTLGTSAEKKLNSTTTLNTIYTTVGLKYINATTTWRDPSAKKIYTASCSTSTNVMLGGDVIREI